MTRALLLCALALLVGCGDQPAATPSDPAPEPAPAVTWEVDRSVGMGGPVELVLRVERTTLDLSQDLLIEEELRVDPGFVAEFPDVLPEDLEGLGLKRIQDLPEAQAGTRRVLRRRLHVEPERVGDCALAERWAFFRKAEQTESEESILTSPRIEITVEQLPADLTLTLPEAPTIYTVDPEPQAATRWPLLLVLLVPLLVAALLRRRRERPAPPPRPAHEVAHEALARLDGLDLLAAGDVDAYFVYLSAILREYVERRFGVRAPERTTQEFLLEASRASDLAGHAGALRGFLRQADAVKFARERPSVDEALEARAIVAQFVASTQQAPQVPVGGAA